MFRFAVAEGKLRKPTLAEGRFGFLYCGSRQRREWVFLCVCIIYP